MNKGIKVNITMSRTLYIDVPDTDTDEQVLDKGKSQIALPLQALITADKVLKQHRINIPNLDISDWDVTDLKYDIVQ
jgi:hypothetical protein